MVLGYASLKINAGIFLAAAVAIAIVGPRLSDAADSVGAATGLGQTLAGALLLGASTSLPGLIVSFQNAYVGRATLAVANSLGGIAAQTLFIALADVALRSDTLEHRDTLAASLLQSAILVSLLALLLIGMLRPKTEILGLVHPVSLGVIAGVVLGFRSVQKTRKHPTWRARGENGGPNSSGRNGSNGGETQTDENGHTRTPSDSDGGAESGDRSGSNGRLYARYGAYVTVVGISGYLISTAAGTIVSQTGVSSVAMGLTLTAIATSLPELVTAVASVRRDAVALAIGDIVGGNAFDTIMVALADVAYVNGSIFRAVGYDIPFIATITLLMTGVLAAGLVRRDRSGLANIGVESYLLVAVYLVGVLAVLRGTGLLPM